MSAEDTFIFKKNKQIVSKFISKEKNNFYWLMIVRIALILQVDPGLLPSVHKTY
jgi:hypothetical protein